MPLTEPDSGKGEVAHIWPCAVPGNRAVLFSVQTEEEGRFVAVLDRQTGRWRWLARASGAARYLPTGHLLYQDATSVLVAPFDLSRLKRAGEASAVLETPSGNTWAGQNHLELAVSPSGTLVHQRGVESLQNSTLGWMDRSGNWSPLPHEPAAFLYPRISPDGSRNHRGSLRPHCDPQGRFQSETVPDAGWDQLRPRLVH